jgi:hypothetical protein
MSVMRLLWLIAALSLTASAEPPTSTTFWNTSGRYVGSAQCAACHPAESRKFHASSMSRALEPIDSCAILQGDVHLSFRTGPYAYSIVRESGKIVYRVKNGNETFSAPLEYAFGQGKAGQTYVYSIGGRFYESRVSYYAEIRGLDLTVGAMNSRPNDARSAAGREMDAKEPRECFGCHTTGARRGITLQLQDYEAGVQCESCHGPGGDHVASVRSGHPNRDSIRSLANMDPQQSNEFCGACHRTWQTVMMLGIKGINTARFPAYRLTSSPCFSLDDQRIACTACHDPHGALVSDDKYYDSKCTACHSSAGGKKVCSVAKEDCVSCHVQRVSPPEAHYAFPDHWFRIVRSKNDYPE